MSGRILPIRESFFAMMGLALVVTLVALDQTVVGTALPTIVAELQGFNLYAWVATSYLLASIVAVPIFGRLGDYFGRRPFVLVSIVLFVGASVMCGMANNMLFLVIARALQGIGGGMIIGTGFACVSDLFPAAAERLRWGVIISSMFGLANAVGPSLGGILTQYYGWRSVFYVNVPLGLVSFLVVWRFLPLLKQGRVMPASDSKMTNTSAAAGENKWPLWRRYRVFRWGRDLRRDRMSSVRIDWIGSFLIVLGLVAFQLFVEIIPRQLGSAIPWILLLVSGLAFYGLYKWERRIECPILPLGMFRNKQLAGLFSLAILGGFTMLSLVFYAPLLFQGGFGLSPKDAGLVITPLVLCIPLGSIINSRVVLRLPSPNWMLSIGFCLLIISCLGVVCSHRSMSRAVLTMLMAMGGFGLGFVLPNLTVFVQHIANREDLGIATALLQTLRMLGGLLGIGATGAIINNHYAHAVSRLLDANGAGQWRDQFANPKVLLDEVVQRELLAQLSHAGHDGAPYLEAAREILVQSIHLGFWAGVGIAIFALWQVQRLPRVNLVKKEIPYDPSS